MVAMENNEDAQVNRKMLRALLSLPVPSEKNFEGGMCLFSKEKKENKTLGTIEGVKIAYGKAWELVLKQPVFPEDLKKVFIYF